MSQSHQGACLCGAIRFKAHGELRGVIYCHCTQCRKQSGHYYAATNVADDRIEIEGAEHLTWYAASDLARRGFCSRCGSVMFWKPNDKPYVSIMAGAFEDFSSLTGMCHIFVAEKGAYYDIDDDLQQFEGSSASTDLLAS